MKKQLLYLLLRMALILLFAVLLDACKKDTPPEEEPPAEQYALTDHMSTEWVEALAAFIDTTPLPPLSERMLPGGLSVDAYLMLKDPGFLESLPSARASEPTTPDQIRSLTTADQYLMLQSRITAAGDLLIDKTRFFPAGDDPAVEPEQRGLAYSPGSREPGIRQYPPANIGVLCKQQKVYGLDNSGLIYAMGYVARLDWTVDKTVFIASTIGDTAVWNQTLKASGYDKLSVINEGQLSRSQIRHGDIFIAFPPGQDPSAGWVIYNEVYMALGNPVYPECMENLQNGPGRYDLEQALLDKAPYTILRIGTGGAGGWEGLWDNTIVGDIDNNFYTTVQIGTQTWMAENLRTTRYKDGTAIAQRTDSASYHSPAGVWGILQNNTRYHNSYGKLYSGHAAVNASGLCPAGWHVPSDDDWQTLERELGMPPNELTMSGHIYRGAANGVGHKLKSKGPAWRSNGTQSGAGSNESGFDARPGARATPGEEDFQDGLQGIFWTSTGLNEDLFGRVLAYNQNGIMNLEVKKHDLFSVRCIKD